MMHIRGVIRSYEGEWVCTIHGQMQPLRQVDIHRATCLSSFGVAMDHVALKEELSLRLVANLSIRAHNAIQPRFGFDDSVNDRIREFVNLAEHVLVGFRVINASGDGDIGDIG